MEQLRVNDYTIFLDKKCVKNINLRVKPNGDIYVSSPNEIKNDKIVKLISSKSDWINKQLLMFQKKSVESKRDYISGEDHYINGRRYILKVTPTKEKSCIKIENKKIIRMYVKNNASMKSRERLLMKYYKTILTKKISYYIEKWAEKIGVEVNFFKIRKMKTRWGSCNIQTHVLLFNLELAKKGNKDIEYVVIHELIHLKERYHNDNFYYLMNKYLVNWKSVEQRLNFND